MIYNPSALGAVNFPEESLTPPLEAYNNQSVELFADLKRRVLHEQNEAHLLRKISQLELFFQDPVDLNSRPSLFKEMNDLITVMQKRHGKNLQVFHAIFRAVTALKNQVDSRPQTGYLSQLEWVELEKAVYHLCDWEDQLDQNAKSNGLL